MPPETIDPHFFNFITSILYGMGSLLIILGGAWAAIHKRNTDQKHQSLSEKMDIKFKGVEDKIETGFDNMKDQVQHMTKDIDYVRDKADSAHDRISMHLKDKH